MARQHASHRRGRSCRASGSLNDPRASRINAQSSSLSRTATDDEFSKEGLLKWVRRKALSWLMGPAADDWTIVPQPPLQWCSLLPTVDGGLDSGSQVNAGLLQIDGLVTAVLVELSAPYLMQALMLGWTKADGCS
jgi:hypothetical protein